MIPSGEHMDRVFPERLERFKEVYAKNDVRDYTQAEHDAALRECSEWRRPFSSYAPSHAELKQ